MNKLQKFLEDNTKPKFTATELAQKLKVHPTLISMWLKGTRKPASSKLKKLSELTGIKIEDLL